MTEHSDDYLLGTTEEELSRLGFQHDVWRAEAEHLWQLGGFKAGQSLLDLGCGPGFASLDLSQITGTSGHVHAIDAAGNYLDYLGHQLAESGIDNVSVQHGDVTHLDLEDASIDGVFARWVFCFLPNPQEVVVEVQRVMRPGATLVIWDYFNYFSAGFFPKKGSVNNLFRAFQQSNIQRGGTYDIGGILPGLLVSHGFELVALEPMCRAIRPGTPLWQWFVIFMDGFAPSLVEDGFLSDSEFEQIKREFAEITEEPETFFFPPPQIGIVVRKPA